jgi:hypothetical protein
VNSLQLDGGRFSSPPQNLDSVYRRVRLAQDAVEQLVHISENNLSLSPSAQLSSNIPPLSVERGKADDLGFERKITMLIERKFSMARKSLLEQVAATIDDRRHRLSQASHHGEELTEGRQDEGIQGTACPFCTELRYDHESGDWSKFAEGYLLARSF